MNSIPRRQTIQFGMNGNASLECISGDTVCFDLIIGVFASFRGDVRNK